MAFENVYLPKNAYKTVRTVLDPTRDGQGRIATGIPPNLGLNLLQWVQDAIDESFLTIEIENPESTTASNGLYLTGVDVRMGGSLIENTTIDMTGFTLNFDNNSLQIGDYGIGTHDPGSAPAYFLGVDATGVIKERTPEDILTDIGGPFSDTDTSIYTDNGTLTGNRVLTMSTFSLQFSGTNSFTAGADNVRFQLYPDINRFRIGDYAGAGNGIGIDGLDALEQIKIGNIAGIGNDTYIQIDDGDSIVNITNELRLTEYGTGNYTGTTAYILAVDSLGNVIEVDLDGGGGGGEESPFLNIYNSDGSLTEDRTLTGATHSLTMEFVDGSDETSLGLANSGWGVSTTDGNLNSYLYANSSSFSLGVYDTGVFQRDLVLTENESLLRYHDQGVTQAQLNLDVDGVLLVDRLGTNVNDARVELQHNSYAKFLLQNTNHNLEVGIYDIGSGDSEIRLYSPAVDATTATNGQVWTLTDDTTGAGEWQDSASLQNLWLNFDADVGSPVAANTTTDTFTFVGGTGIETEIVGDTVVITNTGVGTSYTASNGILIATTDIRLGGPTTGGGDWDFTESRFINLDTFDFTIESSTDTLMFMDASSGFIMIGSDEVPDAPLHILSDGTGTSTGLSYNSSAGLIIQDGTGNVSLYLVSGNADHASIRFGDVNDTDRASIRYDADEEEIIIYLGPEGGGNQAQLVLEENGTFHLHAYGGGDITGTPTYLLAVNSVGKVIEVDVGGGGALVDADNGLIVFDGDTVRLGSESPGTGTHDFTANRYIFLDTFELFFASPTEGTLLHLDGTTDRVGIGTSSAQGKLHVETNTTGATVDTAADELIIENTTNAGISIVTSNSGNANIYLGDVADVSSGIISFNSTGGVLNIGTNRTSGTTQIKSGTGVNALLAKSTGALQANQYGSGTITGTAVYNLAVDASGNIIEATLGGGGGPGQNLWETIVSDSGSTAANSPTDTLTIIGSDGISTSISGDTLTISGGALGTNIYLSDGTLAANRELLGEDKTLDFSFIDGTDLSLYTWSATSHLREVESSSSELIETISATKYRIDIDTGSDEYFKDATASSSNESITNGSQTATLTINPSHNTQIHYADGTNQSYLRINSSTPGVTVGTTMAVREVAENAFSVVSTNIYGPGLSSSSMRSIDESSGCCTSFVEYRTDVNSNTGQMTLIARDKNVNDSSATIGQVATLVDAFNGIWEWQDAPGGGGEDQNLWYQIDADTGSTVANTPTDSLAIIGGTDIETSISGDTLTINWTGASGVDTNIYLDNGSLVSDRTLSMSTFDLTFDGLTSANFLTKWDNTNNRWYTYSIQGGQYLALKTSNSAEIGAWTSTLDSTTNNKLTADSAGIGLYRNVAGSTTEYIKIFDSGSGADQGYIELSSNNSGYISTVNIDGPVTTVTGNGAGSSYSKVTVTGSAIAGSNTIDLTVYDGGSDTNVFTVADTYTEANSQWRDTGIVTTGSISTDQTAFTVSNMSKSRIVRYNSTGFHFVRGIVSTGFADGSILEIWNIGTTAFNIEFDDITAAAANRVLTPNNTSFRIARNGAAILRYDGTSSRWRIISNI